MPVRSPTVLLSILLTAATGLVVVAGLRDGEGTRWASALASGCVPRDDLVGRVGFPLGLPLARRPFVFVRFRTIIGPARPR